MITAGRSSDDALARRTGAGDDQAFATLFERHGAALYRYCRSIVGNDQDAQDAVQNTLVSALAALRKTPLDAPLKPWLFRIAHNESISVLRRRRPTDDLDSRHDLAGAALEGQVEDRARMASLMADLQELPERQRSALVMRELSGLSHDEISVALAIPVSATKQAIFDARRGLQAAEAGRRMACDPVQRAISDGDGRVLRARDMRAHLRGCPSCTAMRDAIAVREKDLAALIPPLPAVAASALLERIVEAGTVGGGSIAAGLSAGGGAGAVAGSTAGGAALAGKAAGIAGITLSGKALAVTAAVLTAAGATTAVVVEQNATPAAPRTAQASAPLGGPGTFSPVGLGPGTGALPAPGRPVLLTPGTSTTASPGAPGGAAAAGAAGSGVLAGQATLPGAAGTLPAPPGVTAPGGSSGSGSGSSGSGSSGSGSGSSGSSGSASSGSGSSGSGAKGGSSPSKGAGAVTETPAKVVGSGTKTAGDVTAAAGQTVDDVVSSTSQAVTNVTQAAGETVTNVTSAAGQTVKQVTDTATQVVGNVVDVAKDTTDAVVKQGGTLLSNLLPKRPK